MTKAHNQRRIQHFIVNRDGISYKEADALIKAMTPRDRAILSQRIKGRLPWPKKPSS